MTENQSETTVPAKGIRDAQNRREVKVDDYPERPYSEAMTDDQRAALDEAGLL